MRNQFLEICAMGGLSIAVAGVLTAVLCPVFVNLIH
jgi:putative effector of murein hydrolase